MIRTMHEIWDHNPIKIFTISILALLLGIFSTLGIDAWLSLRPSLIVDYMASAATVHVHGLVVDVDVSPDRKQSVCDGAEAVRRMVRYKDGMPHTVDNEVETTFIRETQLAHDMPSHSKFTLHLTLEQPISGQGWYYVVEVHDNCNIFTHFFSRPPLFVPAVPVVVSADGDKRADIALNNNR